MVSKIRKQIYIEAEQDIFTTSNLFLQQRLKLIEDLWKEVCLEMEKRYEIKFVEIGVDKDSTTQKLIFNRTVTLRDMWAKEVKR